MKPEKIPNSQRNCEKEKHSQEASGLVISSCMVKLQLLKQYGAGIQGNIMIDDD